MEFRLLGPVEAVRGDGPVSLGGTKIRTLLAALLVEPRRIVPTDRLIDILWDDDPPSTARALVQTYVSTLRRAVGDDVVVTQAPGYLARVADEAFDRHRFETEVAEGRAAAADGRHRDAANAFRAAELLWRGPALGGVRSRILAAEAARLDEQRIAAIEARIGADLELGRGDELIGELTVLVEQHSTRSAMRGQLMLALHRADRTGEALTVFRQGREALIGELGIEPGAELTTLHERILRADPALLGRRPASAPQSRRKGPAQLPPDPPDFVGRDALVAELATVLGDGPVVTALLGPGGVGKSALAVHVAHRVGAGYPDGQLHVDLRGNTDTPASPAEVLGRFLRALQPQQAVPDGTDERMDAYRTLLADRRILIVLDDAANEQQVRPLLPGSGGSSVLVTSRNRLSGLAGARLVELDLLSTAEATALLARVAGTDRITPAPDAASEIVAACGNLPLAVRVAGARLASRRQWTAALLATRLRDERRRLDELSAGDQQIRVSIALSFDSLDPVAHTAICWLGHLGLSDFRSWVLAYALDVEIGAAEQILEQLVDAHLVDYTYVDDTGQVRYRLHDLIRIYAREQAERHEARDGLVAATRRVVEAWSAALSQLSRHIADHVTSGAILPVAPHPRQDADPEVLGIAVSDPRGWLDAEQTSLVLAVERAAELGLAGQAVAVAAVLCASRYALGNVPDLWNRAHRAALNAARAAGDAYAEAVLLAELGQLRYEQDRFTESRQHLAEAAERFRDLADARGQASALSALGLACREQGYLPEAVHFLKQASELAQSLGDDRAAGHCARVLGSVHLERGEFAATDAALHAAMAAFRRAGSRRGEALALRTMGLAHRAQGRLPEAEQALNRALAIFTELGDRSLIAYSRRALAKTYVRLGRLAEAREPLKDALAVHQATGDRWGEAMALRTMGELDLAAGRLDESAKGFSAALEIFRETEAALFCARTLRDVADLELARGDRAASEAARSEALRTFRTFGAREYQELCN